MKLFKSLLVAPAALGLLAPMSVSANQVNIKNISNYSDIENVDLVNSFDEDESIMVISTFGADRKLIEITRKIEKHSEEIEFKYVKKTGPSLRNTLIK